MLEIIHLSYPSETNFLTISIFFEILELNLQAFLPQFLTFSFLTYFSNFTYMTFSLFLTFLALIMRRRKKYFSLDKLNRSGSFLSRALHSQFKQYFTYCIYYLLTIFYYVRFALNFMHSVKVNYCKF